MEPIAIIGFSFKLPQNAEDESSFWEILENGRTVMTEWPKSRVNLDAFYSPEDRKDNTLYSTGAHFLKDDPASFDAPFFSITSKEAISMDPQQRWLLETTYRAMENAGIPVEKAAGSQTAVFAASMSDDYVRINAKDPDEGPTNAATGTSPSILANRLSWYFDLRGPSIQLNTACSTSMISMDLACQSLRAGQSSMAIVAACNLLLSVEGSLMLSNMNFLSPDSVCYSFDHRANGYARGEGVIVFVLKKLSDAVRDSDTIRAVIRATGSNQDGHTPGISQPNPAAQEELIRRVYQSCNLGFESTRYVEAHGTGTQIGDSQEMNALGRIFRSSRNSSAPLYVGSVKPNIGHLEAASGLAGILKSIFILEKGIIPRNALFERMNPKINAKFYNIQVPTRSIQWPSHGGVRRVSVNSFGFGGSNGHIILDDTYHTLESASLKGFNRALVLPERNSQQTNDMTNGVFLSGGTGDEETIDHWATNGTQTNEISTNGTCANGLNNGYLDSKPIPQLLVWSAKDEAALKRIHQQYTAYYRAHVNTTSGKVADLAYTLAERRSLMAWRSFAVVGTGATVDLASLSISSAIRSSRETGMAFIFTGQGAQYVNMGTELLHFPVFRFTIDAASKVFLDLGAEWRLLDALENEKNIHKPEFSQPLCTALQIALIELLRSFNIAPAVVIGHSSGEIAAAYAVGALSLASACKVAYHRGRLAGQLASSSITPGAMMSVNLPEERVPEFLSSLPLAADIHVACVNSPFNVTLSGDEADIDVVKKRLDKDGIFAHKLSTGVSYHSPAMHKISSDYLFSLSALERGNPTDHSSLMISSVTGEAISTRTLSQAQYWVENMVSSVRFSDALQYLILASPELDQTPKIYDFLEVGPHGALRRPLSDTLGQMKIQKNPRYQALLSKTDSALKTVLEVSGKLFTHGYPVSLAAINQGGYRKDSVACVSNTPEYPFDHSQTYWHESRLSRDWRLRQSVPTDVLGRRANDWNDKEPRWRRMLNIEETPWIADHVVGDTPLYPATGTMIMALEAVKRTAHTNQPISGYFIKEATFMNPIVVRPGPEAKTEVMTHLRTLQRPYEKVSSRSEVRIFARQAHDTTWMECFKALIHTEYEDSTNEIDGGFETKAHAERLVSDYKKARVACVKSVSSHDFYKWHSEQGLKYGEAFSIAQDICWDGGELGAARVDVSRTTARYQGLVHPAALDAAAQVCFVAPSNGMTGVLPTIIPHKIRDGWMSASSWQYPQTESIRMSTTSKFKSGVPGLECSFTAIADDGSPLCHIRRLEMLPVLNNETQNETMKTLLHGIEWYPQLSMLGRDQIHEFCDADKFADDESAAEDYCTRLEKTLRNVIYNKIDILRTTDWSGTAPHLQKFVAWMEHEMLRPDQAYDRMNDAELDRQLQDLQDERPSWRLFLQVAQNLVPLVRGDISPVDLLYSTGIVEDVYAAFFNQAFQEKFVSYLNLASHQTPMQRILEVGAGTGSMTSHILSAFQEREERTGGIAFSEYVYTDISPAFFENAKEKFSDFRDRMSFKTIDLELDITAQGFEAGSYDVVFAGSVLHATKNLVATLQNIRRVLKPGGQIVFHETTAPECFAMNFGFGVLAGWWCSEDDFRPWGPTVTTAEWDRLLKDSGFSGNDLVLRDYKSDIANYFSTIVSTAQDRSPEPAQGSLVLIVVEESNELQAKISASIISKLSALGYESEVVFLASLQHLDVVADFVVILADIDNPALAPVSETIFRGIQRQILEWGNILWVSWADLCQDSISTPYPYTGFKNGLLRTLMSEFTGKRIVSLSIEGNKSEASTWIGSISKVFQSAFIELSSEVEYIVRQGRILSGRLVEEKDLNTRLHSSIFPQLSTGPWLSNSPLKLDIGSTGSFETLQFVEDMEHYNELDPEDIEIEAKAWGLSFRDLFLALGRLEEVGFGADCAGIVTRVGPNCPETVKPGDRVCMAAVGCIRTFPRTNYRYVIKISDTMSFEEGSAILNPGMTAYHSLIEVARLQEGEKVLIHAAAGATGQLAILVAQSVGAEVFATVGFNEKKEILQRNFGIPADHIFYSRNASFKKGILRVTKGYGVDVVLNSLVGDGLQASLECVAPYGRFVELGKADIKANSSLPMACFANNVSFAAVDLRHIYYFRRDAGYRLITKTMELFKDGTLRCPQPLHVYPVSSIEEAFRYFQSGKNTGRIIITAGPGDTIQKCILHRRPWKFHEEATYVIVGGLGGLGRAMITWMVSKGAKHFLLLSRSGAESKAGQELLSGLTEQGAVVVVEKCDASSADQLSEALKKSGEIMPPIHGCINAAMELNDSLFDNMTYMQWERTIRSKCHTSWNLHNLLPRDLDFFILLSSLTAVLGNPGQSNYSAGCAFQDALARYRTYNNQKALSLNLGLMRTIGAVAENKNLHRNFKVASLRPVEEAEFLALLDMYCDPSHPVLQPDKSQIAIGIMTPADVLAKNLEPDELLHRPLFASFSWSRGASQQAGLESNTNYTALFRQAESDEWKIAIVIEALARKLARALSISPDEVQLDKPLYSFGVDSLVAVELKNWIRKDFAAEVAVFDIMGGTTVEMVGGIVTKASTMGRG